MNRMSYGTFEGAEAPLLASTETADVEEDEMPGRRQRRAIDGMLVIVIFHF